MRNGFEERESKNSKQEVPVEGIKPAEAKKLLWKHYRHIQRLVRHMSSRYGLDPDDILNLVLDELSKNDFGKITAFERRYRCTFKTFINKVVTNLVYSFLRKKRSREKTLEEVKPDVFDQGKSVEKSSQTLFDQEIKEPLEIFVETEEIELKEKALIYLPKILKNLDKEERRAIKMRYYKGLKISTIARELKLSRHRVKRILEDVKFKIKGQLDEILKRKKNPGS
jgi:RNA polymerase sigma factor (sigma-70 family)